MAELQHLSYSSISTYQLCARSWAYRYVEKVPVRKGAALAFGSAFHGTVEAVIRNHNTALSAPIQEIWAQQWQAQTAEADIDWSGDLPEELFNVGARMLAHKDTAALLGSIAPLLDGADPVIEKRIELRVPGVPVPIIGYIDVITADGVPCDFKTSARAWTADKQEAELQPLFYLAALAQAGYTLNPQRAFRHYVFVKTKTPQVQTLQSTYTPAALFWLLGLIREVWKGIAAEAYPPNPGSWKCSQRWCEYWHLCRGRL